MSLSCFAKGAVVEIQGRPHELIGKLDATTWQLSELRTKRVTELTDEALRKAYASGSLRFVLQDVVQLNARQMPARGDFSEEQWEKAKLRRAYVMAVVELPSHRPTILPIINETWEKLRQPERPPAPSSVLRWKKRFVNAGRDVTALIERNHLKGNAKDRYPKELRDIVHKAIQTKFLTLERGTMQDALDKAKVDVAKENELRPKSLWLPEPTRRLVTRMITDISAFDRCAARYGRLAAMKRYRYVKGHKVANAPLEKVEIDHTQLDVLVVDETSLLPLGRPWLTVCIDQFSRCILGVYIGFEPPGYLPVSKCLKTVITPKTWLADQYKGIVHTWAAHGVMETLIVDNGMEFHSVSLENACYSLGIEIIYSPRRTPWFKPYVERVIGTLNREVAHGRPGTTFSSILERSDYDSSKHAVVRYSVLKEAIYKWVVDVYHQRPHRSLGVSPAAMWDSSIAPEDIRLADDPTRLDAILGASEVRTLTHKGIELYGLIYNSPQLAELRRSHAETLDVDVRVDPTDLGKIVVIGPDNGALYSVPALRADYAIGLSLWQHKVCKRYAAEKLEEYSVQSWLEAKEQISQMIEAEFPNRKLKTRAKMARFKGDKKISGEPEKLEKHEVVEKTGDSVDVSNESTAAPAGLSHLPELETTEEELLAQAEEEISQLGAATPRKFTPEYRERSHKMTEDEEDK